jgi:hypothetical protein
VVFLLKFIEVYGPGRIWSREVERAAHLIVSISSDEPYNDVAVQRLLEALTLLPTTESAEILRRLRVETHSSWPAAAVHAIRIDHDTNYYGIHDGDREVLLAKLARVSLGRLEPHLDELTRAARERIPHEPTWAWAIADTMARQRHIRHAVIICTDVVDGIPDTFEQATRRRFAKFVAFSHRLAEAVESGDNEILDRLNQEWTQLSSDNSHE